MRRHWYNFSCRKHAAPRKALSCGRLSSTRLNVCMFPCLLFPGIRRSPGQGNAPHDWGYPIWRGYRKQVLLESSWDWEPLVGWEMLPLYPPIPDWIQSRKAETSAPLLLAIRKSWRVGKSNSSLKNHMESRGCSTPFKDCNELRSTCFPSLPVWSHSGLGTLGEQERTLLDRLPVLSLFARISRAANSLKWMPLHGRSLYTGKSKIVRVLQNKRHKSNKIQWLESEETIQKMINLTEDN